MNLNGAQIFIECLKREKVDTLFCYIGGSVIPIFDELHKSDHDIQLIQPRHEQGGTHAADGYARSTGKTGVVLVTSGPGATNTVTGIATAYMDSSPLVVVTGQVPTSKIGTDAFQEADITGITLPITKTNFLVKDVKDLAMTMKKAFYIANSGRPGPVVVDIPSDIQRDITEFIYPEKLDLKSYNPKDSGHPRQIKAALELLKEAKKPLLLVGGGVNLANATGLVNSFIKKYGIPAVSTLMGHGINPNDNFYYGGIGMHGTLYGNHAIQHADLILALGVRFSDRILGDVKSFAPEAKIVHVDIDPAEIGKNKEILVPIVGNIETILTEIMEKADILNDYSQWISSLTNFKKENPMTFQDNGSLKPQYLLKLAQEYFPENTIVVSDVGQNQMWVSQYFRFRHPRTFLSSGGLGTMGFALPAATGAKVGNPDTEVLMVSGDGGFQMNIQELTTINKYKLNVKMLVLDNCHLGMVRQWQELLCDKRYSETDMSDNPDFVKLGNAYGIKCTSVDNVKDAKEMMKKLAESNESMLLHAKIERGENVLPMVPAGKSLNNVLTKI